MNGGHFRVNSSKRKRLLEIGTRTQFGPDWPGRRCLATTRRESLCQKASLKGKKRCRLHGGLSTGPRTAEGRARIAAAHLKHGRDTRARREAARKANAEIRRITVVLREIGAIP